jgi:hypothetical protein
LRYDARAATIVAPGPVAHHRCLVGGAPGLHLEGKITQPEEVASLAGSPRALRRAPDSNVR